MTTLVPSRQPHDQEALRARIGELEALLGARGTELSRARADLAAFKVSYRQQVGLLHDELDELERALAEAELGIISERLGEQDGDTTGSSSTPSEPGASYTSDAVRRLFRDVARMIHPDLASDELTRDRRHSLMIEANRAYALGDEERLRWILQAWERSPEAVEGNDSESVRVRLERRAAQIEEQLDACAADLAALTDSPIGKLKAMVDEAAAGGKDLIADMVRRLERDIMVTRNRLEAIQWRPSSGA